MNYSVDDIFNIGDNRYKVILNDDEDTTHNRGVWCNKKCAFNYMNKCIGSHKDTGDCQPRYRKDKNPIYFEKVK